MLGWRTYTGTEGNPVNRRSLKRQRSIQAPKSRRAGPSLQGIHLYMVYTYTWYTQAPKSPPGAPEPPSELTACCTPATGLQRRKHLRGVESLSVLSLGGAFAF